MTSELNDISNCALISEDDIKQDIKDCINTIIDGKSKNIKKSSSKKEKKLYLLKNHFNNNKVIIFDYPDYIIDKRIIYDELKELCIIPLKFLITEDVNRYNCIINSCKFNGLTETTNFNEFNLLWGMHIPFEKYSKLQPFQKVNHFPGSIEVGHKGKLYANLAKFKRSYPREYDFAPESFTLPRDVTTFEHAFFTAYENSLKDPKNLKKDIENVTEPIWIIKPPNSSCGNGIYLATKINQIDLEKPSVVSRYISNPFLINKRKFDLRIYVCVTSILPLRIYLYDDGLARFATKDYTLKASSLKKTFIHLTNFSVNKKSEDFEKNDDASKTDTGSKWSLKAFLNYAKDMNIDPNMIVSKISDVVIKTFISAEVNIVSTFLRSGCPLNSCFELFGFDILFDSELNPWIMEVNCFPSLSSSSLMDKDIKTKLVSDVFHLIGVEPVDATKTKNLDQKISRFGKKSARGSDGNMSSKGPLSLAELFKFFNISNSANCNLLESSSISVAQASSYLSRISLSDFEMLRRSYEETTRSSNFACIFPSETSWDSYGYLFELHRLSNVLLTLFMKLPKSRLPEVFSHPSPYIAFSIFNNSTPIILAPNLNVSVPIAPLARDFKLHSSKPSPLIINSNNNLSSIPIILNNIAGYPPEYIGTPSPNTSDLKSFNEQFTIDDDSIGDSKYHYDNSFDINSNKNDKREIDILADLVIALDLKSKFQNPPKQNLPKQNVTKQAIVHPLANAIKPIRPNVLSYPISKTYLPYKFISSATIFSKDNTNNKNLNRLPISTKPLNRPISAGVLTSSSRSTPRALTFSYLDKTPH